MSQKAKPSLKLIKGERREGARHQTNKLDAELSIHGIGTMRCCLTSVEFGKVALHSNEDIHIKLGHYYEIYVIKSNELLVSGKWKVCALRPEKEGATIVFESYNYSSILEYEKLTLPEIFLKFSRYRLFLLKNEADLDLVSRHLTELKDFPVAVECALHIGNVTISGKFDFTSERRELDVIEISLNVDNVKSSVGKDCIVAYEFLGARYLSRAVIVAVDSDFKIASLSLSSTLLTITARQYDRYECDLETRFTFESNSYVARMVDFSVTGCTLKVLSDIKLPVKGKVILNISTLDIKLSAEIVSLREERVGLRFLKKVDQFSALRKLLLSVLPPEIIARSEANYSQFIELYKKVGYSSQKDEEGWREKTKNAWRLQDQLLPANATGGLEGTRLVSSTGTLPMGAHLLYGHSFCMTKTAVAAGTFLKQALNSLAYCELVPGAHFYSGSYAKNSRFTTRLHVAFDQIAHPDRQTIIHAQQLFPSEVKLDRKPIQLKPLEDTDLKFLHPKLLPIFSLLSHPHPLFKDLHTLECFLVSCESDEESRALVIRNITPSNFTAADMFGFTWIFSASGKCDLKKLVFALRSHELFFDKSFEVIGFDGSDNLPEFDVPDYKKPAFWTFNHKDDFGPIIASMSRSIYSILRKYPTNEIDEVIRVL